MRPEVWLNGIFVPAQEARVAVFDAGLQHGVGLFETMLARGGRLFRAEAHMRRLEESAAMLELSRTLSIDALARAAQLTVDRSRLRDARVRLTVTGGTLNLLARERRPPPQLTMLIVAQPPVAVAEAAYERGISVLVAEPRVTPSDPFGGHKTVNYWPRLAALQLAAAAGMDEALWFTTGGRLASASLGNAFIVREGRIVTPPARRRDEMHPVLPGITRAAVIEIAGREGIPLAEDAISMSELLAADEVFLTNSTWGILPVGRIEQRPIGDGSAGPVARRLRRLFTDLIESETRVSP